MTVESSRPDIVSIQMLRGVAALMVVFVHLDVHLRRLQLGWIDSGWLASGVDIFFVISGFIMWVTTVRRPQITAAEFMRNRIVRIVPLYWAISGLVLATALLAPDLLHTTVFSVGHVLASFLFLPWRHPVTGDFWPLLVPGWTLNFEMLFYVLFALAIAWSGRSSKARLTWLAGLIFSVLALAYALRGRVDVMNFYANPIMLEFLAGSILGVAFASGRIPVSRLWWVALPIGFAVLWRGGLLLPTSVPAGLLGGTVIVAGALFSPTIRIPFLPTLGDASYSLYLTHVITLAGVAALWTHQSVLTGALLFGSICIVAAIAVAVLCYRFIERPMSAALKPARSSASSAVVGRSADGSRTALANSTREAAEGQG
jgi:exopolysaccharide production protein ExoZ